jgi:3-methyladenine DNA glycosylase Tag
VENPTLNDHLAIITRAVMQAGMSWVFIDARWESYVAAFDRFDVDKVASYGEMDVDRLMNTDGVIHSRSKIEGTIRNARVLIELEREYGSIRAYQTSFADYDAARADVNQRFAFMGDLNTYYWHFRTGAPVPDLEEWMNRQEHDHPRMREMVQAGTQLPKPDGPTPDPLSKTGIRS